MVNLVHNVSLGFLKTQSFIQIHTFTKLFHVPLSILSMLTNRVTGFGSSSDTSTKNYNCIHVKCDYCKVGFTSAYSLLSHFVKHAQEFPSEALEGQDEVGNDSRKEGPEGKEEVDSPPLLNEGRGTEPVKLKSPSSQINYVVPLKPLNNETIKCDSPNCSSCSDSLDGGDDFNPLKFCIISMEERDDCALSKHFSKKHSAVISECYSNSIISACCDKKFVKSVKKRYACHLCPKVFGWSTDLRRHILSHTGERPFKCYKCNAAFTRNFLLQKHLSKIHPCTPCPEENLLIDEKVQDNLLTLKNHFAELNEKNKLDGQHFLKVWS